MIYGFSIHHQELFHWPSNFLFWQMIWRCLQNLEISLTGSPPNFHWSAGLRPDHYSMAETVDGTYLSVTKTSRSNAGPLTGKPARPTSLSLDGPDGLPQVSAPSTGLEFHPLPSSVVNQRYLWTERECVYCTVRDDLHGNISVKLWEKFPGLGWHQLWFWIAVTRLYQEKTELWSCMQCHFCNASGRIVPKRQKIQPQWILAGHILHWYAWWLGKSARWMESWRNVVTIS